MRDEQRLYTVEVEFVHSSMTATFHHVKSMSSGGAEEVVMDILAPGEWYPVGTEWEGS